MTYSPEQESIRTAIFNGKSVSAPACAGAGKSSTARPLINTLIKQGTPVSSIPFQVSLYEAELAAMPLADVLNAHKRGFRALGGKAAVQVSHSKVWKLAESIDGEHAGDIAEIVTKAKGEHVTPDSKVTMEDVCEKYSLNPEHIPAARQVLALSDAQHHIIDCEDMLRFNVLKGKRTPVPFILIDEAQDSTPLMCAFVSLFIDGDTKGLVLGDPERQALMQFAGGSPETFYKLSDMLGAESIPLTWNFRCGSNIVDMANGYYPSDMKAAPGAIPGTVSECSMAQIDNNNNSALLCEMNTPLLAYIVTQLEKRNPVQFRPGKLWDKVRSIMWGFTDTRYHPLGTIAGKAEERLYDNAGPSGVDPDKLESLKCLQLLETLAIALGYTKPKFQGKGKFPIHPIEQVLDHLSSGSEGITCMTGHTAKGLQWRDVYHLPKVPAPRPDRVQQPWEKHQWLCVGYVIRTRATDNHYTVTVD